MEKLHIAIWISRSWNNQNKRQNQPRADQGLGHLIEWQGEYLRRAGLTDSYSRLESKDWKQYQHK